MIIYYLKFIEGRVAEFNEGQAAAKEKFETSFAAGFDRINAAAPPMSFEANPGNGVTEGNIVSPSSFKA